MSADPDLPAPRRPSVERSEPPAAPEPPVAAIPEQEDPPISESVILSGTSTRRGSKERKADFLARITHLNLGGKGVRNMDGLHPCLALQVLYLYDNEIEELGNLAFAQALSHLYLQNNCLYTTLGLPPLRSLTKLYLGGNFIGVVEGLEACPNLQELHLAAQRLEEDAPPLLFSDETLHSLSRSLAVLDVSTNRLESLEQLHALQSLSSLSAKRNYVTDVREVAALLQALPRLEELDLRECPVTQASKFRDRVVVCSRRLRTLDGKEVIARQRDMLIRKAEVRSGLRKPSSGEDGPAVEWLGGRPSQPPFRGNPRGGGRGPGLRGPGPGQARIVRAPPRVRPGGQ